MKRYLLLTLAFLLGCTPGVQKQNGEGTDDKTQAVSLPGTYETVSVAPIATDAKVRNVVLMIGDGMSLAHIANLYTANKGRVNMLDNAQAIGLAKTTTADTLITDSGAAGTAMACGVKVNYHSIAVDPEGRELTTLVDLAHASGLGTGVVVTCRLWDATPAAFLAHNVSRDEEEDLIGDFPTSNCDLIIGGGAQLFQNRTDGRDIIAEMESAGYTVSRTLGEFSERSDAPKHLVLVADKDTPLPAERGDYLSDASIQAMDQLKGQHPDGFFIMIEGSQLDDYGHFNDLDLLMQETADFDRTVGAVMKWAEQDGETLVVVTADHETGGLTLVGGSRHTGTTVGHFSTGSHSGVLVPVYTYGAGANAFTGVYENTEIFHKICQALNLTQP